MIAGLRTRQAPQATRRSAAACCTCFPAQAGRFFVSLLHGQGLSRLPPEACRSHRFAQQAEPFPPPRVHFSAESARSPSAAVGAVSVRPRPPVGAVVLTAPKCRRARWRCAYAASARRGPCVSLCRFSAVSRFSSSFSGLIPPTGGITFRPFLQSVTKQPDFFTFFQTKIPGFPCPATVFPLGST